ncbi:MAG: hypothetical protein DME25_21995 [Verrucomicrobia bacterium]|nr:MAG: hypothetical protein DME25_21995 [Verrucomicrobiota bacterium]
MVSSAGYSVLANDVVASGSYSFHLAQPDATDQFLTLNPVLLLRTNSQLAFSKRLGWATSAQVARAQISTNSGAAWQDLWSQPGSGSSGESFFTRITNSLSAYAGALAQVRFVYDFTGGSYYPQTSAGVGLYLDDIAISNADQPGNQLTNNIPAGSSFSFYPTNTGDYLLHLRAQLPGRTLDWGPSLRVTVATPPPSVLLAGKPVLSGGQIQLDFTVANYRTNMTFQLWKASNANGTWAVDNSAVFSTLIPNSKFRATTSTAGAARAFYRLKASY